MHTALAIILVVDAITLIALAITLARTRAYLRRIQRTYRQHDEWHDG